MIGLTAWVPTETPERLHYLKRTLEAMKANLDTTGCDVKFVIGAEASKTDDAMKERLEALAVVFGWTVLWHPAPSLLARNVEMLWELCAGEERPYYFNMQDDWLLNQTLRIAESVEFLEETPEVGVVRYRWRVRNLYVGPKMRKPFTLLDASGPARKGYFGHSPYLGRLSDLQTLSPMDPLEVVVSGAAIAKPFGVVVRYPPCFYHIGKKTTIHFDKGRPVDVPEDWKP